MIDVVLWPINGFQSADVESSAPFSQVDSKNSAESANVL